MDNVWTVRPCVNTSNSAVYGEIVIIADGTVPVMIQHKFPGRIALTFILMVQNRVK